MPPRDEKVVKLDDFRWAAGLEFVKKPNGRIDPTSLHNVQLYLLHHPHLRGLFWYDEFADEIYVARPVDDDDVSEYPRSLQDHDETEVAMWLNEHGLSPSIRNAGSALRNVAFKNKVNPILDWANDLKWDGQKRIDAWLTYYAGAEPTEYTKIVGRRFLISAMARIIDPGCKVDTMLILEGAQGLKKSSMIAELAGPGWFSDQVGDISNKDSSQLLQGIWLIEVAEMDKFKRQESSAVKGFLSRRFDRYRPPYARNVINRKRRCVFFGTVNPDGAGYLKDTTGNRRYWPVTVKSIDLDAVKKDRDQLWAEAKLAFQAGEQWWFDADDELAFELANEQDARREDDPWEPKVWDYLQNLQPRLLEGEQRYFFTSTEALWNAVSISIDKQNQPLKNRLAGVLKRLGCIDHNNKHKIRGRHWEFVK